jgi:hypothetical protein
VFTARYGLGTYIQKICLVFINEVKSVYSAVRTGYLYTTDMFGFYKRGKSFYSAVRTGSLYMTDTFGFYKRGKKCLQRSTD